MKTKGNDTKQHEIVQSMKNKFYFFTLYEPVMKYTKIIHDNIKLYVE